MRKGRRREVAMEGRKEGEEKEKKIRGKYVRKKSKTGGRMVYGH